MGLDVGMVVTGKVTGIKKFGAFVSLENGKSGLVHISEIANSYVNDVADHLRDGQEVKVKIISIDEAGRINLSIKKAEEPAHRPAPRPQRQHANTPTAATTPKGDNSFEDKLKQFMQESNNKISGIDMYAERRGSRRKRG